jgi:hypothetical protein
MQLFTKAVILLVSVAVLLGACNRGEDNPTPTDDNEKITTATLSLTNTAAPTEVVTATIDGIGNAQPNVTSATLTLRTNATYNGSVTLLDKSKTPTVNQTDDIRQEGNEHLFVYTYTPATSSPASLTVTATDKDSNPSPGPYPIGITTSVRTGSASSGNLNVVLRHQPNVKNGTASPGSSDLDVTFPVVIR